MLLLEVNNLSFERTNRHFFRKKRSPILKNVTLQIEEGSTVGLIGESGCGKTTLARCVAGLLTPCSGSIVFSGINIFPEEKNRQLVGTSIQLLFQNHSASLDPRMNIKTSLLEGVKKNLTREATEGFLHEVLSMVSLPDDILERYPKQLSGGQRQRVALARTLTVSPKLLILDEPTSSLDAVTQIEVLGMISCLKQNSKMTILYISHDLATTSSICDTIAVIHDGTIVETGPSRKIIEQPQHPYTFQVILDTFFME